MSATRILVVEDDVMMLRLLTSHLAARGYEVEAAGDGWEALRIAQEAPVHLVLLDITLPGQMNGLEVCRRLRSLTSVPIILVTAAQRPETKVQALDYGGDDYLTKPFNADELLARIRAVLRRARTEEPAPTSVHVGDLTVDLARREAHCGDEPLRLTRTEFDLLTVLLRHADRTMTYQQILEAVWGPGYDDIRAVHVHMSHLRRKLGGGPEGSHYIQAVPGVGYRFRMPD